MWFADTRLTFDPDWLTGCLNRKVWYNAPGERNDRMLQKPGEMGRAILLLIVAAVLALIVLASAVSLLPPPPGPPTPTPPQVLDRPEGLPRIQP